ncbi:MAG: hypothetical protein MUE78_10370 [Ilumatobacteraceae bacterium]|jgi:hypothetical protein|nr:hypothetical protein [Ilumatobacteraceae bacterium]
MTVDDRTRLNLHRKLETVLGSEEADTLMAHLPPVTWNEVSTKDDLAQTAALLRTEMHAIRSELRTEMQVMATELRSEMHAMGSELRTEMHVGFADVRTEMAHLRADFVEGTNRQIKWLVTFAAVWSSLLVTVVRLMP